MGSDDTKALVEYMRLLNDKELRLLLRTVANFFIVKVMDEDNLEERSAVRELLLQIKT